MKRACEISNAPRRSSKKRNPAEAGFLFQVRVPNRSGGCLNVRCLFTLRALHDLEAHLLTFFEGLEAIHLDGRKVSEQILAAFIRRDEPETLRVVEPLDRTGCHTNFPCNSCHYHEQFEKLNDRILQSPPPHKLTNGIFSKIKAVEKSASLIVGGLYSAVKNILRRSLTRCKERISRVFPAFLAALPARNRSRLPMHSSGSFFIQSESHEPS